MGWHLSKSDPELGHAVHEMMDLVAENLPVIGGVVELYEKYVEDKLRYRQK